MKGYVYSIRSSQTAKIYIGSTQSPLSVRMAGHRAHFKSFKAGIYDYVSSYDILEFDDAYIECIEVVEFNDKVELTAREGHFQRTMECVNRNVSGRTKKQYRADNAEAISEYNKQYYVDNAEAVLEQQKQYRADNAEAISEKNKQYKTDNAEAISEKNKQYKTDNADKIKARRAEIITCECGKQCVRGGIAHHRKSAKHINAMAALTV